MREIINARKLTLLIGDIVVFLGSLALVLILRYQHEVEIFWRPHVVPFSILFLLWIISFNINGLYDLRRITNDAEFLRRLFRAMAINAGTAVFIFYFIPIFGIAPRLNLFGILVLSTLFTLTWRYVSRLVFHRLQRESILFLGLTDEVISLASYLKKNPQYGYRVAYLMKTEKEYPRYSELPMIDLLPNLKSFIEKEGISLIIISPAAAEHEAISRDLIELLPLGVGIRPSARFYEEITGTIPVSMITERWFLENPFAGQRFLFDKTKHVADVLGAIVFSVPVLLLFPFIALAISLESRGSILYHQTRVGKNGKIFTIYKFRSMRENAETKGVQWASTNDPRVTRVGRFLRKTRLDELPQIFSVLKGDLSFVGPRPERPEFVHDLRKVIPFYDIRHIVLPGLTGWAQVNFPYGASVEDAYRKLQYDLFYIKNRTVSLDIIVLLKTIATILSAAGS